MRTPILFLVYNRPEPTNKVFNEIRKARPKHLFIAADGPRKDVSGDHERCESVRGIVQQVDWDCDVKTLFREENLGCKIAVSGALDWFFENVEEGIILEDDCLPGQSFFAFCRELLDKYRKNERIMMISGNDFLFGRRRTEYSYCFSINSLIWGWATWRRAWKCYDREMTLWPQIRDGGWLYDVLGDRKGTRYWTRIFDRTHQGEIDTWDYQWRLTCWANAGLIILPSKNLVSNVGFGRQATHTKGRSKLAEAPVEEMDFPLKHPPFMIPDTRADELILKEIYRKSPFWRRLGSKILKFVGLR
jgi:hypothetical protein